MVYIDKMSLAYSDVTVDETWLRALKAHFDQRHMVKVLSGFMK